MGVHTDTMGQRGQNGDINQRGEKQAEEVSEEEVRLRHVEFEGLGGVRQSQEGRSAVI